MAQFILLHLGGSNRLQTRVGLLRFCPKSAAAFAYWPILAVAKHHNLIRIVTSGKHSTDNKRAGCCFGYC